MIAAKSRLNSQAKQSMGEVLEYEIAVYGHEKQEVITIQHNLVETLQSQANYTQALQLFQAVLPLRQRILGTEHPHTVSTQKLIELCIARLKQNGQE